MTACCCLHSAGALISDSRQRVPACSSRAVLIPVHIAAAVAPAHAVWVTSWVLRPCWILLPHQLVPAAGSLQRPCTDSIQTERAGSLFTSPAFLLRLQRSLCGCSRGVGRAQGGCCHALSHRTPPDLPVAAAPIITECSLARLCADLGLQAARASNLLALPAPLLRLQTSLCSPSSRDGRARWLLPRIVQLHPS